MAICPECDNVLNIDEEEVEEGEVINCDECGSDFEIVSVEPLQIAPVDAEGYDDEEDDHHKGDRDDEDE